MVLLFGMKAKDNVEEILMYANRNYDEDDIRWEWGYIMSEYTRTPDARDTHTRKYKGYLERLSESSVAWGDT